ncbi:MAG: glutaredoxin 3 [Microgenomates bacterium OLB22]|nr:MAG: glutaredoxin 3 [Microgenomates bacterium OLB22]
MNAIIYTLHDCPFSAAAKKYLTDHGITFEEKDVESDKANLEEMLQKSKDFEGVPFAEVTTDTGVITLRGFTQAEWDEKLGGKINAPVPAVTPDNPPESVPAAPTYVEPAAMPQTPPVETPVAQAPVVDEPVTPTMPSIAVATPQPTNVVEPETPVEEVPAVQPEAPMETVMPAMPQAAATGETISAASSTMDNSIAPTSIPATEPSPTHAPEKSTEQGEDAELEEILKGLRTMTDQQAAPAPVAPVAAMPQTEVAPTPVAEVTPSTAVPAPAINTPGVTTTPEQPSVTVAEGLGAGQGSTVPTASTPAVPGSPMGPADLPPIPDFQQKTG